MSLKIDNSNNSIISTFSTTKVILKWYCWFKLNGEACGHQSCLCLDCGGDCITGVFIKSHRIPHQKGQREWVLLHVNFISVEMTLKKQYYNGKKTTSLTSGAGKTGQPLVKEWN